MPCWLLLQNIPRFQAPRCLLKGTVPPPLPPCAPMAASFLVSLWVPLSRCNRVPSGSPIASFLRTALQRSRLRHNAGVQTRAHRACHKPASYCSASRPHLPCCSSSRPHAPASGSAAAGLCRAVRLTLSPRSSLCSNANFPMTPPLTTLLTATTPSAFPHSLCPFAAIFLSTVVFRF